MPVRPPAVVKVLASLNSCAPELSRISAASRCELLVQRAVRFPGRDRRLNAPRWITTLRRRGSVCSTSRLQPSAAVNLTPRPTCRTAPGATGAVGRHQTVQERQADGDERDDGGHDERPRPAPPIEAQEARPSRTGGGENGASR